MSQMIALTAFLAAQDDYSATVASFQKEAEISTAEATKAVCDACAEGEVEAIVEERGSKKILTAALSKRAVRRINREKRKARAAEVSAAVLESLQANRPQKIGTLVSSTGFERNEVLDALRAGRDVADGETPVFYSFNDTKSNFHMEWSTDPANAVFPEPEEEEEPEVEESAEADVPAEAEADASSDEE